MLPLLIDFVHSIKFMLCISANESDLQDGAEKSPIARTKARGKNHVV
jgi:hypothetical protein